MLIVLRLVEGSWAMRGAFALSFIKRKDIKTKMKVQTRLLTVLCLLLVAVMLFSACNGNKVSAEGKWADAVYLNDTEFGNGSKTVVVTVKAAEDEVELTIHSDKQYLGDALLEHGLIEGDESEFGLYVKRVNGILADYDVDKTYWGFYKDGEMMMVGVSAAEFADGEHYELVLEG